MFLDIDQIDPFRICAISDTGEILTYGELCDDVRRIKVETDRKVAFIFCENSIGAFTGYAGFLSCGVVPVMIDKNLDSKMLEALVATYQPAYFWLPGEMAKQGSIPVSFLCTGTAC